MYINTKIEDVKVKCICRIYLQNKCNIGLQMLKLSRLILSSIYYSEFVILTLLGILLSLNTIMIYPKRKRYLLDKLHFGTIKSL